MYRERENMLLDMMIDIAETMTFVIMSSKDANDNNNNNIIISLIVIRQLILIVCKSDGDAEARQCRLHVLVRT